MVRTAEALAVCRIEGCAAVTELLDVISEQPMLGRGLGAAASILNPLTPGSGIKEYLLAPSLMLFRLVDGVSPLWLDADCSSV